MRRAVSSETLDRWRRDLRASRQIAYSLSEELYRFEAEELEEHQCRERCEARWARLDRLAARCV